MAWAAIAALGTALALAGAGFGSPSLLVPGFALIALALTALVWVELAARGARVVRADAPIRVVEGETYPLRLRLRRGWLPPPGGELADPLLAATIALGPLRPTSLALDVPMHRRGRRAVGGTEWRIRDPLGLRTRRIFAPPGEEILVLPRIEPVAAAGVGLAGAGGGPARAGGGGGSSVHEARAAEFEVDGLRPYRPGSPASRIHWPAFARSGEVHERRMVAGTQATPLVVLDAGEPDDSDALDRAVRATASLCVHLARRGGCALLLPGHREPTVLDHEMRAWPSLHARLALVAAGTPAFAPSRARRGGSVLWVTAGAPDRALGRVRAYGAGPHHLVSTRRPRDGDPAFTVAGCWGLAVRSAPGAAA